MGDSLKLVADTSSLGSIEDFLRLWWGDRGLEDQARFPFELAIEELFVNVATHGQAVAENDVTFEITLALHQGSATTVIMTVADDGAPFDPTAKSSPDTAAPLDDRTAGGLGIHLTRSLMDRVEYSATDGRNCLRLEKRI